MDRPSIKKLVDNVNVTKCFYVATIIVCLATPYLLRQTGLANRSNKTGFNSSIPSHNELNSTHIQIAALSGINYTSVYVNGKQLVTSKERGFHIAVLKQSNGGLLDHRVFEGNASTMVSYLNSIHEERIIVFTVKVDLSTQLKFQDKLHIIGMGSKHIRYLKSHDQWAMVAQPGVALLGEKITKGKSFWDNPVILNLTVPLVFDKPASTNTCDVLLDDGEYDLHKTWQPSGCKLHQYSRQEARSCFKRLSDQGLNSSVIFLGDSRIRNFFGSFSNLIRGEEKQVSHRGNTTYVDLDIGLSSTSFYHPFSDEKFVDHFINWRDSNEPPRVIIAGTTLWHMMEDKCTILREDSFPEYTYFLNKAVEPIKEITKKGTTVIWTIQEPIIYENRYGTGVHKPFRRLYNNHRIDMYNVAAVKILQGSGARMWHTFRKVSQYNLEECKDGMHHGMSSLTGQVQILLNLICNKHLFPNEETTCCSKNSEEESSVLRWWRDEVLRHNQETIKPNFLQIVTFTALGVCFVIAALLVFARLTRKLCGRTDKSGSEPEPNRKYTVFTSLAKMSVIMAYFFLCDHTDTFAKATKDCSGMDFWLHFWIPLGVLGVLGVLSTEKCKDKVTLNRQQTNEWKGWMQLVILVYHVTGASKVLPIYMHLRAIVSAYLFLTGYGHFCYVWRDGQITIARYFQVMFRLNFLTVLLCCCMNQPYQNYYYVPLASFWFTVTFIFLALPPRITSTSVEQNYRHYIYLGVKFAILCAIVTGLYLRKDVFNAVFSLPLWQHLFMSSEGDLEEWWFLWQLDRYSTLYGMVFGWLYLVVEKNNVTLDMSLKRNICFVAIASLLGLFGFTAYSMTCTTKEQCNAVHSYIAFVPIISFVAFRNVFLQFRVRYSTFFAWFGRISLELFVCQYHIWLADDTRSVLVIVSKYPLINLVLTSSIFLWVAYEVHRCTGILLHYIVPCETNPVLHGNSNNMYLNENIK